MTYNLELPKGSGFLPINHLARTRVQFCQQEVWVYNINFPRSCRKILASFENYQVYLSS